MLNARTIGRGLVLLVFNAVVACALLEGIFVFLLHSPRLVAVSPGPLRLLVQQVYRHFNRALIQFEPRCARYDPEVTYTLRPGGCTFGNVEFTNEYRVNRLGLRDDDTDLVAPEIVVVGDSHAMGWGVAQDESLPRVIARRSGRRVLNAAISSYGTVREMKLLDRLDTTRMKVLVIQYTDNDLLENLAFQRHGNRLPIRSEAEYRKIVQYYAAQRPYYPGKYVFRLFMKVSHLEAPEPEPMKLPPATPTEEAELFLNAVEHASRQPLDAVQLVVFEVNQRIAPPRPFIAALDQVARRPGNPAFIRRLVTLNTAAVLTPKDFYVLDDHMNPRGHRALGEAVAEAIGARLGE